MTATAYRFGTHRECRTGAHDRCVFRLTCECDCHVASDHQVVDVIPPHVDTRDETPAASPPATGVSSCTPSLSECTGCGRQIAAEEVRCSECTPRCSVPLCSAMVAHKGLCEGHNLRRLRHGWELASTKVTKAQTLWRHIERRDGHWLWTGRIDDNGYGRSGNGWAHRDMYELIVGPIADGLQLDHLCRVARCVNPSHLEPVTPAENTRRAFALRTHCPHGHPYDEANTYMTPSGHRGCRACHRETERLRKRRIRARCAVCGVPTGGPRYCSNPCFVADEGPLDREDREAR